MIDFIKELDAILKTDPLGLLDIKPKASAISSNDRLASSFEEINTYIQENGHEPTESREIHERQLFARLKELRKCPEKIAALKPYDVHNLLGEPKEIKTIDDVLDDDVLGLLDDDPEDIFTLKNVTARKDKADFVARRKPCKDFDKYENNFIEIQKDLSTGARKLQVYKEQDLRDGGYYVLDGILVYLEKTDLGERTFHDKEQDKRTRMDGRTRCIFENGTESNMFLRSLGKQLYKNGKSVTESNAESLDKFNQNLLGINDDDQATGHIYVLTSLTQNPDIQNIDNLYKIGYCTTPIEKRIAGAENDPTYLMAPVKLVASYQCYNMNPQKFESLLHTFFHKSCLDIEVADSHGNMCNPKEWFIAPIKVINEVIQLVITREIVNYRYDAIHEEIVER